MRLVNSEDALARVRCLRAFLQGEMSREATAGGLMLDRFLQAWRR